MTATRRLAAILAADVVGYSRLMGEDEAGTARAVSERREAATPVVVDHGGRIVKTTGDGLLLEFPSVMRDRYPKTDGRAADMSSRRRERRAVMQLKLAFLDPPDLAPNPPAAPLATAWRQLDEASRVAALEILARLIARMLSARSKREGPGRKTSSRGRSAPTPGSSSTAPTSLRSRSSRSLCRTTRS
jgi:class 3 adenylate cyclase